MSDKFGGLGSASPGLGALSQTPAMAFAEMNKSKQAEKSVVAFSKGTDEIVEHNKKTAAAGGHLNL